MVDKLEERGPEATRLIERLCGDPEKQLTGFHVDWEPGAVGLSPEERAAEINRALDDCEHPITGLAAELCGSAMLFEDEAHPRFNVATKQHEPLTGQQKRAAGHADLLRRAADKLRELATLPTPTEDARERVKVLEEALGFYAREFSWRSSTVYMCGHSGPSNAEIDRGQRARTALGNKETDRHG